MTNNIQYLHDKEKYNLDNLQNAYLFACRKDIELIMGCGVNSFLIGENFMKSKNIENEFSKLLVN